MSQRLLITGGTGYLGAELVRRALAAGCWDVAATYHARPADQPNAQWLPLDLTLPGAAADLFHAAQPDVVIHTAYVQTGPDLWPVSALGSGQIAQAVAACGARLIHLSTDALFDGERADAYTEADPPSPITPYGSAKAEAERLVAQSHPAALIVRTSLIYGGSTPSVHEAFILDAADGRSDAAFFRDEMRCPVLVADLADALLELAPQSHAGLLNIAGPDAVSRYEFAQLVAAAHGRSTAALRSAWSADGATRRPRYCVLDIGLAQQTLRTRLRGVREWARSKEEERG